MPHPPIVHRVLNGLVRAELAGINPHTLAVALDRVERANIDLSHHSERGAALILLQYTGYPETINELSVFLAHPRQLTPADVLPEMFTEARALNYTRWLPAFFEDADPHLARNSRLLCRWLVNNCRETIRANQESLDLMRRLADDPSTSAKTAAYLVFTLGSCGTLDDYERVTRQAEAVIMGDRENLDMVAEGLYRLYPPALVNALQYFLDQADGRNRQQLTTGLILLEKVAEIDDKAFWRTYADEMGAILDKVSAQAGRNGAVLRLVDQVEKQLGFAALEDGDD